MPAALLATRLLRSLKEAITHDRKTIESHPISPEVEAATRRHRKHVAEARATAQRAKLDTQVQQAAREKATSSQSRGKKEPQRFAASRRVQTTIAHTIEDYLQDHARGNHSDKTLEWHRTALGLMQTYLEEQCGITLVTKVDAPDISAWFAHMRTSPGSGGKVRSERTIQTYARSARAFFHWLVRRRTLEHNPFDHVVFPKVGRPLIQTITDEEFEKLLLACAPPHETGPSNANRH